jgi:anti-sigma-K factor RskA
VHGDTLPTLEACLRIGAYSGLNLPKLLTGNLRRWEPRQSDQLVLGLTLERRRREAAREHDWADIRKLLRAWAKQFQPISVAQAAQHLGLDVRLLYLRVNTEARALGEAWKAHQARKRRDNHAKARLYLAAACRDLLSEGRGITLREVQGRVPEEVLLSAERIFDLLYDIKQEMGVN